MIKKTFTDSTTLASDVPRVHPTAIIEAGVEIGARTAVWDSVHIRGPSRIGHDCVIGEKAYIAYGVTVGSFVKINAGVYICTGVKIEDRVMIAAGVVFTNDLYPRAFVHDSEGLAPSGPTAETLRTTVREGATIGAGAIIGPGVEVGSFAMVGMGTVVTRDVTPHGLVYGNPAQWRGFVCVCGAKLANTDRADGTSSNAIVCDRCGKSYISYHAGANGRQLLCK